VYHHNEVNWQHGDEKQINRLSMQAKNEQEETVIVEQNIKVVECFFRFYSCESLLRETNSKNEIRSFNVD
jgi:hypothetical protein